MVMTDPIADFLTRIRNEMCIRDRSRTGSSFFVIKNNNSRYYVKRMFKFLKEE